MNKKRNNNMELISQESFNKTHDIDILQKHNHLIFMYGNSRFLYTHGTRNGIINKETGELCDWFGTPDNIIARNPERYSVVLAFGPHPKFVRQQWVKYVKDVRQMSESTGGQQKRFFSNLAKRTVRSTRF
eukprot:UN28123